MTVILRERNYMLDELGDPAAPVGSRLWSLWVANEIRKAMDADDQVSQALRDYTTAFKEQQAWQELGCLSWEDFCERYLHRPASRIDAVLSGAELVAARAMEPPKLNGHGGDHKSEQYQGENPNLDIQRNSAEYWTARIARDRPDVLERMKAGEFRSVNAATIAAGFKSADKRKVYVHPHNVDRLVAVLLKYFDEGERAEIIDRLVQGEQDA